MMRWIIVAACVIALSDATFKIRKCCGKSKLKGSSDCDHSPFYNNTGINIAEDDWPWWIPSDERLLSKDTGMPLANFPNDSDIYYGVEQPCCGTETAYLPSFYNEFYFFDDGSMEVLNYQNQMANITYPPLSFCIDRYYYEVFKEPMPSIEDEEEDEDEYLVLLCPCNTQVCALKCCAPRMSIKIENATSDNLIIRDQDCQETHEEPDTPWVQEDAEMNYVVLNRFPQCGTDEYLKITPLGMADQFYLMRNGSALVREGTIVDTTDKLKFCLENVIIDNVHHGRYIFRGPYDPQCRPCLQHWRTKQTFSNTCACDQSHPGLLCTKKLAPCQITWKNVLYGTLSAIGAFFLLVTIIVYSMVMMEWTVNDQNLIAQVWSLLFGYLAVATLQFGVNTINHTLCVALGYVIFYAFLASFFWLNVLCVDLAWAFSEIRMIRNLQLWQKRRRFFQYSVYAWLCPAIILLVVAILDLVPNVPPNIIKPEFLTRCWFSNASKGKLYYFYGPVAVLLTINAILFIYTVYKIWKAHRQTSTFFQDRANREKPRTLLYVKLFTLMGLSWGFEIISWAVGGPEYYWYITDTVNLLRAIFIFIILCWKKEIREQLRQRFGRRFGRQRASPSIVTTNSALSFPSTPHSSSMQMNTTPV